MTIRTVQKFDPQYPNVSNVSKLQAGLLIVTIVGGLALTSPLWVPWVLSLFGQPPPVGNAIPVFKLTNICDDTAVTAAPSVKIYDARGMTTMPSADIEPFLYLDTLAETPDGEFTATISLPIGMWIYLYVTETNAFNFGGFYQVQPLRAGTTGESIPISLQIAYNSGTLANDMSAMLVSGGVEVDGQDATANVTFGASSYRLDMTVAEGYGFASKNYVDPATGYFYRGGFIVLDLDLTTARCTVTGSNIFEHFTIGTHEYWAIGFDQFINDAQVEDDGTYGTSVTIDVSVGADDAMDLGYYDARRPSQIKQASFGTDIEANGDNLDNLNFATS